MYSFTNNNDSVYIHIQCECERKLRAEEMYLCFT